MNEQQTGTRADWLAPAAQESGSGGEELADALKQMTEDARRPKSQEGPEEWLMPMTAIGPKVPGAGYRNQGYAYRKITQRLPNGKESVRIQPIPICTDRSDTAVRQRLLAKAPRPPTKNLTIEPNSEEGKALGLTTKTLVAVPQLTDQGYRDAINEFAMEQLWCSVAEAIDLPLQFTDASGAVMAAVTSEQKVQALREFGFTNVQVQEMSLDVQRISTFTVAERRSFFGRD